MAPTGCPRDLRPPETLTGMSPSKYVLLSTAEGDDKPFKYPAIFAKAKVAVLTKVDLLPHVDFDVAAVRSQVATLNPGVRFVELSARTGEGMDAWCALLAEELREKRAKAV